jgi:hypothetical protein
MFHNIAKAPSPDVGTCQQTGSWSSKDDEKTCQSCFANAGESAGDYFYCEGSGCVSKYSSEVCGTGSLVAKNTDQCSKPCVQQGFPPAGGGCSDLFDCDYKNGEVCQKKQVSVYGGSEERGFCVQGDSPQPNVPVPTPTPGPTPSGGSGIMDLFNNCSQDMSNPNSVKKCLGSISNLTCDDINNLVMLGKKMAVQNGKYDILKADISQVFTDQNEKMIIDVLNQINNALGKVNCVIDAVNKNFGLQTPQIDTDNIKKQVLKNIYSNASPSLQNSLKGYMSSTNTISLIVIGVLGFLVLILLYLYLTKK